MKGLIDMMFNIDEKDILEIRELIEDYENKKLVSEIIDKAWDATDYDDIEKFTKIEKLSDEAYKVEWNTRDKLIKKLVKVLGISYQDLNHCLDKPKWYAILKKL